MVFPLDCLYETANILVNTLFEASHFENSVVGLVVVTKFALKLPYQDQLKIAYLLLNAGLFSKL